MKGMTYIIVAVFAITSGVAEHYWKGLGVLGLFFLGLYAGRMKRPTTIEQLDAAVKWLMVIVFALIVFMLVAGFCVLYKSNLLI